MTDLAMVSYRGIPFSGLRGHDGPVMLFDFYWFPNAFGWECPYCPPHIQNGWYVHLGGVIYAGPRISFDPVAYMRQAADDMQMPNVIYDCVPLNGKVGHEKCDNSFFQAFADNYESRYKLKVAWVRFIWSIFALFYGSMVMLNEWFIAYEEMEALEQCSSAEAYSERVFRQLEDNRPSDAPTDFSGPLPETSKAIKPKSTGSQAQLARSNTVGSPDVYAQSDVGDCPS
ncbi:hypothetical protein QIS74_01142 [Colletotrichum tabaci]|uniref:Uncharacterized protein n=1 Tax=Colletotrichum tabaci TaxID=1209068 RepID=A0AAV9TY26_9PEZI